MGAVYRATDTRLNRDVAIKMLPEAFASDPDRLGRFTREAQVLASLNHPNIAAVYGIEERAIVMELVEGPTLADRIAQGPIPIEEALTIAQQIGEALEAAHEKGIIHRDLKPANIKFTPDGNVKVLDFGLAKLSDPVEDRASAPTVVRGNSPTLAGVIMGTAGYMAPEQARGLPIDKRADIWAFGVVLWEMLTGRELHSSGETIADTLAAVITKEPDWSALPGNVPAGLRRLLGKCLEKDRKKRLRDIGDAWVLLDEVGPSVTLPAAQQRSNSIAWGIAGVMGLVALVALWALWRAPRTVDQPLMSLDVDLGSGVLTDIDERTSSALTFAVSPDGKRMVYPVSQGDQRPRLAVWRFDRPGAVELPGTEGALYPFFSPDGLWIGYFGSGTLRKVSVDGGTPVTICQTIQGRGASWGEDGTIVANLGTRGGLHRVHSSGGEPVAVSELAADDFSHRWPEILPGGKAVLFTTTKRPGSGDGATVNVLSLSDKKVKTIVRNATSAHYLRAGYLLWHSGDTLFAAPFDSSRLELKGDGVPVVQQVAGSPLIGRGMFDVAANGTLIYRRGLNRNPSATLQWLDSSGKTIPLLSRPGPYREPRFSPDGKRVAMTVDDPSGVQVAIFDLARDSLSVLARMVGGRPNPTWTPDGEFLAYNSSQGGNNLILWKRTDGGGAEEPLISSQGRITPGSFSPDRRWLVYSEQTVSAPDNISIVPVPRDAQASAKTRVLVQGLSGRISLDGKWVAYTSGELANPVVYVTPFDPAAPKRAGAWQVSAGAGTHPIWSPRANELFYTVGSNIMVVPYTVNGTSFRAERPRVWGKLPVGVTSGNIDIGPDGKRFVVAVALEDSQPRNSAQLTFLLNFGDELRRKIPIK